MLNNRETIYSAIFALFSSVAVFNTAGRKVVTWSDVDPERQPALFMAQTGENAARTKGLPTKWTLTVKFYLYCHSGGDHSPVGPIINPLLDAITALVETKANPAGANLPRVPLAPGETNTLGIPGVSHCWIEGTIETDEGALGNQGVAIIPLNILAT